MWSIRRRKTVNLLAYVVRSATGSALAARTREEAIEELCHGLEGRPGIPDRAACVGAVCAREELTGTGTGGGLAIPHARLSGLERPVLVFGRSVGGIDWDAPDGEPVHVMFLLLSPVEDHGLQLQILAALARGLSHGAVRDLIRADSEETVWGTLEAALRAQDITQV
jgi:mannitol/fructose-specific phosphotransferase system IIA component (Ntr-type)